MLWSGWLKNDSLCLRLQRSSKCCVASWCNGLGIDIQIPDKENRLQPWEQQIHHALVWILSWHCNSERISWSGTQQAWRWWEVWVLPVGHYGLSNIDSLCSHLQGIQKDFAWCFWRFNKKNRFIKSQLAKVL